MLVGFLFIISLGFILGGVAVFTSVQQLTPTVLLLWAIGSSFALMVATIAGQRSYSSWNNTKAKTRLGVFFSTCLLMVLLVPINWLAIRYPIRFDLTDRQIYTLSPQTAEILQQLKQPLEIAIYQGTVSRSTETLLSNYQSINSNIRYRRLNPILQRSSDPSEKIVLQYGENIQALDSLETPFGIEINEAQLSNAIANLLQPKTRYIYWLESNRATARIQEYSQGIEQLQQQRYEVKPLDLANYQVPQNTSLLAIAKPLQTLSDVEITRIQQYLDRGGSLLAMLLPNTEIGLESIWQEYGIQLDNRLLIDSNATNKNLSPTTIQSDRYGDSIITQNISEPSIFANSRPIKIEADPEIQATPLVTAGNQAWAESDLSKAQIGFDSKTDLTGDLHIAVAVEKENAGRLVVFGNGVFATNNWIDRGANSKLFLASIDWLSGQDRNTIDIPSPETTTRRLTLTSRQTNLIHWLGIKIFPSMAAISAIVLWWRKKART